MEWLECQKYTILARRLKILNVEVDVVARSLAGVIVLIEVKSLRGIQWLERRVTLRQQARLRRVAQSLAEGVPWLGTSGPREVELWLATVGETKSSVQVFQDL